MSILQHFRLLPRKRLKKPCKREIINKLNKQRKHKGLRSDTTYITWARIHERISGWTHVSNSTLMFCSFQHSILYRITNRWTSLACLVSVSWIQALYSHCSDSASATNTVAEIKRTEGARRAAGALKRNAPGGIRPSWNVVEPAKGLYPPGPFIVVSKIMKRFSYPGLRCNVAVSTVSLLVVGLALFYSCFNPASQDQQSQEEKEHRLASWLEKKEDLTDRISGRIQSRDFFF